MNDSQCRVGVVVDFGFGHLMHQRDLGKCCKQLLHCYSINRRLKNPLQFHITSLSEDQDGFKELEKHQGFRNWDVKLHQKDLTEAFCDQKDKIVYLTAESENVLHQFEDGKLYVIGGLVDHNNHKGLCHRLAVEKGLSHARLPLEEHVEMKTRKVLTIDHVFQIIANVASEGIDWREAILKVLPARKGVK